MLLWLYKVGCIISWNDIYDSSMDRLDSIYAGVLLPVSIIESMANREAELFVLSKLGIAFVNDRTVQ